MVPVSNDGKMNAPNTKNRTNKAFMRFSFMVGLKGFEPATP